MITRQTKKGKNASPAKVRQTKKGVHPCLTGAAANTAYCNRTYCSTLEDMRKLISKENYAILATDRNGVEMTELPKSVLFTLSSLIEELQVYGNRMEAGLGDMRDYNRMKLEAKDLKRDIKDLQKERDSLLPVEKRKRRDYVV